MGLPDLNRNRGFIECSIDVVDGDGVEWVGCVAADIHNHRQSSLFSSSSDMLVINEIWYLR